MKAQKILFPIVAVIGALIFFSVFIVKEVNQAIVLQFGDPKKIIIEKNAGSGVVPYLPLPELNKKKASN